MVISTGEMRETIQSVWRLATRSRSMHYKVYILTVNKTLSVVPMK